MIKKNNYIRDLDNEELKKLNIIKGYLKKYQMNLKI